MTQPDRCALEAVKGAQAYGDMLTLRWVDSGGNIRLQVSGQVDMDTHSRWLEALRQLVAKSGENAVYLEAAALDFIDARGASLLVEASAHLAAGRRLIVTDPPAPLRRILAVLWAGGDGGLVLEGGPR